MIPRDEFRQRRARVAEAFSDDAVVLKGGGPVPKNGDDHYPFRQDSNLLYLTGLTQSRIALILVDGESVLFAPEYTAEDEVWMGPQPSLEDLRVRTGVDTVKPIQAFDVSLAALSDRVIHTLPRLAPTEDGCIEPLRKVLVDLRLIKSDAEVAEIERSLDVTAEVHTALMRATAPGVNAMELMSVSSAIMARAGGVPAYGGIVTEDGAVLHGAPVDRPLRDGRLLLADVGVAVDYASDITRTWPVNGTFSEDQRAVYEIVLATKMTVIDQMAPGVNFRDLHIAAERMICEGLIGIDVLTGDPDEVFDSGAHRLFFPHGLGHAIGLDTHDIGEAEDVVADYGPGSPRSDLFGRKFLRFARDLEPGHVTTVEPGIYFVSGLLDRAENFGPHEAYINLDRARALSETVSGIRIEDDVLVTEDGARVLGPGIPERMEDVEQIVGSGI
jgi:Xaa-Pro aminopeptidase